MDQELSKYAMEHFPNKIKTLRAFLGLSMYDFGKALGYSATHISRFEKGVSAPKISFIENVCSMFGVKREYFDSEIKIEDAVGVESERSNDYNIGNADNPSRDANETTGVNNRYKAVCTEVRATMLTQDERVAIGNRLRETRNEKGFSRSQLSKASGVDGGLISSIENHRKRLTLKQAVKLADTLEVGVDWLMYGDPGRKEYPLNERLEKWLWNNEDIRKSLWKQMKNDI